MKNSSRLTKKWNAIFGKKLKNDVSGKAWIRGIKGPLYQIYFKEIIQNSQTWEIQQSLGTFTSSPFMPWV